MRKRRMRGLDLSHWNSITPERIRSAGFEFAIIKATEGVSFRDPSFDDMYLEIGSWNNCHPDKPIHIGCYHYLRATTTAEAEAEADFFINSIRGLAFDMPIFVDVEEREIFNTGNAEEITRVFCETVEKAGYWAGFYTYYSKWFYGLEDRFTGWLACWSDEKPVNTECGIWQFTSSWDIDGKRFDANDCYINYPAEIRAKGLNGLKPFPADVNRDGEVNTADLVSEMKAISNGDSDSRFDVNGDGTVDTKDLVKIMKEVSK